MADLSQFGGMWLNREDGASEGIRTLDTHVGNVMLYEAELRSRPNDTLSLQSYVAGCARGLFRHSRRRFFPPGEIEFDPKIPALAPTTVEMEPPAVVGDEWKPQPFVAAHRPIP